MLSTFYHVLMPDVNTLLHIMALLHNDFCHNQHNMQVNLSNAILLSNNAILL